MMFYKTIAQKKAKEQLENAPPYASPTVRVFAALIDVIVSSIFIIPLYYVLWAIIFGSMSNQDLLKRIVVDHDMDMLIRLLVSTMIQLIVLLIVTCIYWMKTNSTPGKQLLRLRIVDAKTLAEPTRRQYVWRAFGYIVASIPMGLGFVIMGITKKKQGLHDFMAGTVVINAAKLTKKSAQAGQSVQSVL